MQSQEDSLLTFRVFRCFKWTTVVPSQAVAGQGLNVCYGRHTGYGGYGNLARGGRQILLRQESLEEEAVTWIRLEDGLVPENVTLNATYGQDEYHPGVGRTELKRYVSENVGSDLHVFTGLYSAALLVFLIIHFAVRL